MKYASAPSNLGEAPIKLIIGAIDQNAESMVIAKKSTAMSPAFDLNNPPKRFILLL